MRVLLTTDTIGGVWTFTRELTEQLLTAGHAVALVSFGRQSSAAQAAWTQRIADTFGHDFLFRASDAPLEWMQDNTAVFPQGAEVLISVAEQFHPQLLHSNQFCWGALPLDIPRIVTAHSDVMSWAAATRPNNFQASAWLARYRALVHTGLEQADSLVAPTRWMRNALLTHFHVPCRFHIISNGRNLAPSASDSRKLQAISVGRLWDQAKGLDTLLQLNSPMPLLVAGEDQFESSAPATSAHITPLGLLDEPALLKHFTESSLYLATSVYEPFGLAPLEAALCGCAIVARDLDSFREVWGEAALYFRDTQDLECILLDIAHDKARLLSLQQAARRRASLYRAERMSASYIDLYESLLMNAHAHEQEFASHAA